MQPIVMGFLKNYLVKMEKLSLNVPRYSERKFDICKKYYYILRTVKQSRKII